MIGASLYILACTTRNRIRVRLRRLREPRYLIGAIVGVAYFYFTFFARFRTQRASTTRRRARGVPDTPAALAALSASGPALTGLGLMVVTALSWVFPADAGLLDFSEAEVQFLFPAPVARRWLLIHRLLRSQLGMLFGALIVGIVTPGLSGYSRLRIGIGMWLLLCTGKVYSTGVSLARTRLRSSDREARRVAWLPVVAMTAALAVVGAELFRLLSGVPLQGVSDFLNRIGQVSSSGLSRVVMWPFVALASPIFAPWPWPFLRGLASALVVLAVVTAWVLKSDETFQDAAEHAAQKKADAVRGGSSTYRVRSRTMCLAPSGPPELALAWKAATQTMRVVDLRILLRLLPLLVALMFAASSMTQRRGVAGAITVFALAGTGLAVLLGPQSLRIDMRQDLAHLELLKTWPVRAAAVVRGQILWPGVLLAAIAWTMIALGTVYSGGLFGRFGTAMRYSVGAAAMIVAPGLAFAQLAIHNAVALLFPAWVPLGSQRPRGLDAMGQRIIMLGGTMLALIVMTIPGVIAGGTVWFAARFFIGAIALVPGALVCSTVLLVEVLVMTELLGPAYERLDLLAVERAE